MFLDMDFKNKILNEAPGDPNAEQNSQQTQFGQNDETYNPNEQDANMDIGEDMNDADGQINDGIGMDDGTSQDPNAMGDPNMEQQPQIKDVFKKRKLFNDYKELLAAVDSLLDITNVVLCKDLPDDAKKVYLFINDKMQENREKLFIVISEQFVNLSYQQLMTIYMYIKMATKLYSDMIKQIINLYDKE